MAQEDEVELGVEFEVGEQLRHARRRVDGVGQRRRRRAQREPAVSDSEAVSVTRHPATKYY